ncbi:MAG: VOC family protein [Actinomycetota bacterium]|nr:VOC family protein [Actinomycetota bacterium]
MLDHLVLATPDLDATCAAVERDGIALVDGGPHVGVGTRNRLAGLGAGCYLEVVGPDPEQPRPGAPRPFGIDRLAAARLVTWAVRVPDLDAALDAARAAGHDPGPARAMSRRRPDGELLAWRLAFPPDDLGGVLPFLIDWGATAHPSGSLPGGSTLDELVLEHPEPERVRAVLAAVGGAEPVTVRAAGAPALTARIDGVVLR